LSTVDTQIPLPYLEGLVAARLWGFKSPLRHRAKAQVSAYEHPFAISPTVRLIRPVSNILLTRAKERTHTLGCVLF
jgi:hypothetical protein